MSERTFEGFAYWDFPLGDGWLILQLGLALVLCLQNLAYEYLRRGEH